jgi:hypothetical protein
MEIAPILILGYNRPDYLKNQLGFLKDQRYANLYIAIDGPVPDNRQDELLVKECRELAIDAKEWSGAKLLFSDTNSGCYLGVTKAIDWFFENVEFGIILEDDLVFDATTIDFLSKGLLEFMERMDVGSVCAFSHASPYLISGEPISTIMSSYPSSWGWATWANRWVNIERDFSTYPRPLFLFRSLKYGGLSGVKTWLRIRKRLELGELDSWAYRWLLTHTRYDWKAIVPSRSLVTNIGFRADATHTKQAKEVVGIPNFINHESKPRINFKANLDQKYNRFLLENVYGIKPIGIKLKEKIKRIFLVKQ